MPKLAAITMVRDEEDIIGRNILHLLEEEVDLILVLENLSTDRTGEILKCLAEQFPDRVIVKSDKEEAYYQSKKMTALAEYAYKELGASHILPFDADEFWQSTEKGSIREIICNSDGILGALIYEYRPTLLDPPVSNPFVRMGWRLKTPLELRKCALKWQPRYVITQGNHAISNAAGEMIPGSQDSKLMIRHYPYRTPAQFLRKVMNGGKAYKATDLAYEIGQHWRMYYRHLELNGPNSIYEIFLKNFYYTTPWVGDALEFDPAPAAKGFFHVRSSNS